jgi:hypothetical protein
VAFPGIIFSPSYLTDFSYFSLPKIFQKLQDMESTFKKGPFKKGV